MKRLQASEAVPRLILACAFAAGCGWRSNGLDRLNELHPPAQGAAAPANSSACQLPDDPSATPTQTVGGGCLGLLQGSWAVRLVQFGSISPLGEPWNLTTTDLFLAALSSDKSSLQLTFCGEENSLTDTSGNPIALAQTTIPPALAGALAASPVSIPLPGDGTLHAGPLAWLWGVQGLSNPTTDPLPTAAGDPHVWDQDGDGNPGVTVDVTNPNGQLYLVKRALWTFGSGTVNQTWLAGPLTFGIEQNALGASNPQLTTVAPITPRGDCTSLYQMGCVDPTFTCQRLLDGYTTLFLGAPG